MGSRKTSTSNPDFVNGRLQALSHDRLVIQDHHLQLLRGALFCNGLLFPLPAPLDSFSDLTTMIFSSASLVFLMISRPVALKPRSASPASAKEILTIQSSIVWFFLLLFFGLLLVFFFNHEVAPPLRIRFLLDVFLRNVRALRVRLIPINPGGASTPPPPLPSVRSRSSRSAAAAGMP